MKKRKWVGRGGGIREKSCGLNDKKNYGAFKQPEGGHWVPRLKRGGMGSV